MELTLGVLQQPQQPPVCDLLTPAQPQNQQPLQVGGDGAHGQVGHVDAGRQVQLTETTPEELSQRENGQILQNQEGGGGSAFVHGEHKRTLPP